MSYFKLESHSNLNKPLSKYVFLQISLKLICRFPNKFQLIVDLCQQDSNLNCDTYKRNVEVYAVSNVKCLIHL